MLLRPLVPADAVDCETVVPADGVDCEIVEEPVDYRSGCCWATSASRLL